MKNSVVFFLGFLTGVVFVFIAALMIGSNDDSNSGMTYFQQPGDIMDSDIFVVKEAFGDNFALAYEHKYSSGGYHSRTDLLVLVTNDEGELYYDEQKILIPKGKCMRQIGIYRYEEYPNRWKTVPIVKIMDSE